MNLFVIGNGFDRIHNLPTSYDKHFKTIAEKKEQTASFWDIYQSQNVNIWSDFESCLAHPDFNNLEEIFNGYVPDYYSDYERDRNSIITQVDLNGKLKESLYEFANRAEQEIDNKRPDNKFIKLFNPDDLFLTFNYTHTLEKLYKIDIESILHIHGEVGKENLLLGYPEGDFLPELYNYDPFDKGNIIRIDFPEYINRMLETGLMDSYISTAYNALFEKTKSFSKTIQVQKLKNFLDKKKLTKIIVVGHSCNTVDYKYFESLYESYSIVEWYFYYFDVLTKDNIEKLISLLGIKNVHVKHNDELKLDK